MFLKESRSEVVSKERVSGVFKRFHSVLENVDDQPPSKGFSTSLISENIERVQLNTVCSPGLKRITKRLHFSHHQSIQQLVTLVLQAIPSEIRKLSDVGKNVCSLLEIILKGNKDFCIFRFLYFMRLWIEIFRRTLFIFINWKFSAWVKCVQATFVNENRKCVRLFFFFVTHLENFISIYFFTIIMIEIKN